MNDFELILPNHEELTIADQLPQHLKEFILKGFTPLLVQSQSSRMLFEKFEGDGYEAWRNTYLIKETLTAKGIVDRAILECTIMYENSFFIDWKDMGSFTIPKRLVEVYYSNGAESTVIFPANKTFTTIDFHLQPELLQPYRNQFPVLERFMKKVDRKETARLFDSPQFTSPAMDRTIQTFLSYQFTDELAPRYYDNLLHIFIIQLLESIDNFAYHKRKISPEDVERAIEAKRLLTIEPGKQYTINTLCRMLHTNPYNLKVAFQHIQNCSIGRYKKYVLMEKAKVLLKDTNSTIDEVAITLGYSGHQSFTAAFRNYYKITPDHWRKHC